MGVFINTDFCCLCHAAFEDMNEAGLKKQVDFYAVPGVEAILFNRNAQRAYYESKVFDPAWAGVTEDADGKLYFNGEEVKDYTPEPPLYSMVRSSREMSRNVPDAFAVRYRYCHEKGVEMWHSMRMNDTHWVPNPEYVQHSTFWREHPEFRRAAYRKKLSGNWSDQALDFLHAEVREYTLAMIAEYLSYECDGIELDFLRSLPTFAPGGADAGMPLMTQLMQDVRKLADEAAAKFGHRVRIMVRIPPDPQECLGSGLDVLTWARNGLCDIVAPCPSQPYSNTTEIPVTLWKQILPAHIILAPGMDVGMSSGYPGGNLRSNCETDAGFASVFYHRGADAMYFYNHFYSGAGYIDRETQRETYEFCARQELAEKRVRRHVSTQRDSVLPGHMRYQTFWPTVWKKSGIYHEIDAGGCTAGRTARIIIGSDGPIPEAEVRLNTIPCKRADELLPEDWHMPNLAGFACFEAPAGVLHDGLNGIDVISLTEEQDFTLYWAELDIF